MKKEIIASLYDYGVWANEKLLALAAQLNDEQFNRRLSQGYQSIHDTLAHLASADWRWFARWRDATPLPAMLTGADLPTVDAISAKWAELIPQRRAYIESLSETQLDETIVWARERETQTLPRWQAMLTCANHGTQHRSEIAAMLTDMGRSPGNLDYVYYCREKPKP